MKYLSSRILIGFAILMCILIFFLIKKKLKSNAEKELIRLAEEKDRAEKERIRLELAEIKRLKEKDFIESLQPNVNSLNLKFDLLLKYKNGYFNNNKLLSWKSIASTIYSDISGKNTEFLRLEPSTFAEINKFKNNYLQCEKLRKEYNQKFIKYELEECETFFSDIDNASLDQQQRLAIVKDEDNNLVIAGAGSGKTTTVAGKVAYVIDRFNIKPEEILLITFTKKASDEMKERIRKKMQIDIEVNTFHSFGRKVIGAVTNNMPSVIDEREFSTQMKNIFSSLMCDAKYADKVIKFITEYKLETKDTDSFESHGEYINYLKDNNIKSYKTIEVVINGRVTILREQCKSLEEVKIANYLFLNGVNYKYEEPYQHPTADNIYAQWKPDFYLPDYDIYIEHFALIDKDNNVPHWFSSTNGISAKDKYNSDITWKRSTNSKFETTLIETYSYENKADVLLTNLKSKLESVGVEFKPRTTDEIWEILNSIAKDDVSALDTLIKTFLNLFKSNNFEIIKVKAEINNIVDEEIKTRHKLFISIYDYKSRLLINFNF